ncbi:protein disulfide-isomerase TMX3-like [Thalassophryne amazonica]|uniref:protein disulfide-isomerase TMX3-like n=1 Tax=Thalassophryne amazonica TaxID=390379 RepID=UPI0014723579|nr:protein disulfide-isomerase TMX3-like [Thalassophryne amazonica]
MSICMKVVLSAVLRLTVVWVSAFVDELDNSFVKTRTADNIWLINFYAPWCSFCKQLDPVWHQIGLELRSSGSLVYVGKIDATINTGELHVINYTSVWDMNRQPYEQCWFYTELLPG